MDEWENKDSANVALMLEAEIDKRVALALIRLLTPHNVASISTVENYPTMAGYEAQRAITAGVGVAAAMAIDEGVKNNVRLLLKEMVARI